MDNSTTAPRAPWWMYVAGAVYVLTFCFNVWHGVFAPTGAGLRVPLSGLSARIRSVAQGWPAERAGLRAGDIIEAANGSPVATWLDWHAVNMNFELDRPVELQVRRGNEHLRFQFVITTPFWRVAGRDDWIIFGAGRLSQLIMLLLAIFVAFSRPNQLSARLAALLFAALAVFNPYRAYGWSAMVRRLPIVMSVPISVAGSSWAMGATAWLSFAAVFPQRSLRRRWQWALVLAPSGIVVPPLVAWWLVTVYAPSVAFGTTWQLLLLACGFVGLTQDVGGFALLFRNYRRARDVNDRRRLRLVLVAMCLAFSVVAVILGSSPVVVILGATAALTSPLAFAYAVLRHRMFDIQVIIRQGLQYALARRVLVSLVPALGAVLVLDLLLHRDQTLATVVTARGWIYLALGGLAFVAHTQRHHWMEALDRRFFRERYDAQRILREVVEGIHGAGSFEKVAPQVVAKVETGLHPEFAALLVREPREASFRVMASAPAGRAPGSLPAEGKLVGLLRVLGKPIEVSMAETGWLKEQLPHEETQFLRESHIDLLVPVTMVPGRTEALLTLGPKRSEEPYGREDRDLLVAIAKSLALLLEKPTVAAPLPARVSEAFEECPQCGACYDAGAERCAQEGAALSVVRLPRLLAGRYRLDRRLGRGGMGAVYEALDTALERRVAVKVIRDDLVGSADAAERFRREARAAASFAHPNVVTVHDFGVAADTRAFLVMELLEGRTLREELKRQMRIEPAQAVAVLRGVCEAVEAAHRRQLIHRDLKPENIFLARAESGEVPKVLDFGIAKFLPAATQATADTATGLLMGTMAYLSPEQWLGQPVDAASDLWALAVVTYEMLTGAQPFAGATAAEWRSSVLAGRFAPLIRHVPEAPARWEEFFARTFAIDRASRPSSARAFFSELEQTLS